MVRKNLSISSDTSVLTTLAISVALTQPMARATANSTRYRVCGKEKGGFSASFRTYKPVPLGIATTAQPEGSIAGLLVCGFRRHEAGNVARALRTEERPKWTVKRAAGHTADGVVPADRGQLHVEIGNLHIVLRSHVSPASKPEPQNPEGTALLAHQGRPPPHQSGGNDAMVNNLLMFVKPGKE